MDYPKCFFATLFAISLLSGIANGFGGVMRVHRRFVGNDHHFEELMQHDAHRHARFLRRRTPNAVDVPIGGNTTLGLYYTHLAIGTPPKNYTVHIDSGSHILWIACQDCIGCPIDNDTLGIHLTPYNPKTSTTAKIVAGGKSYCQDLTPDRNDGPCPFRIQYGDETRVSGYYVRDYLTYNRVSGDHKSKAARAKITFGCTSRHSLEGPGDAYTESGVEGLIGFANHNISMISQLASSGITRGEFAHCLEPAKGGGVFAIGHVVKPVAKMLSLVPYHLYALWMRSVELGGKVAELEALGLPEPEDYLAAIDSGTSACYLPEAVHDFVRKEIFSNKSELNVYQEGYLSCFNHSGSLDMTGFPPVNFQLSDSTEEATLTVAPRDYLVKVDDGRWCIGFKRTLGHRGAMLGDIALSNKLVIYDVENEKIGWTEHDCSSSIEVEDGKGRVCDVGAHSESSPTSSN